MGSRGEVSERRRLGILDGDLHRPLGGVEEAGGVLACVGRLAHCTLYLDLHDRRDGRNGQR